VAFSPHPQLLATASGAVGRRRGLPSCYPVRYAGDVSITQTPLPGPDAAAIGVAAFVVVYAKDLWSLAQHFDTMAHEGMHAITGSILGFGVQNIELKPSGDGITNYHNPIAGGSGVFTGFVGYLGPSSFGLAAAGLINLGYIIAVLWLAAIFLVVLLLKLARFSFGWVSVPIAIALLLALTHYASVRFQVVMAYGMTWLLLLSGVRSAAKHGANAGDALILKGLTHLPRWLWALLWLAGTLVAVCLGWRLLVVRR
jgi:Peptidase M50B-like